MTLSKRKKIILTILCLPVLFIVLLTLWGFIIEPNRLIVKEAKIALPNFPAQLNGLKIVAISDIHGGSRFISESKMQSMVQLANKQDPDLIVLLGDFVTQSGGKKSPLVMDVERIAESIKGFRAKHGVYAVLGNHDWWFDGKAIQEAFENVGIKVLEGDVSKLSINNQTVWILGVPDYWTRQPIDLRAAMKKIDEAGPMIAITHNPDVFPELPPNVILTLAGHTHGGQVNIPFIGAPQVPSRYGKRYVAGHIVEQGNHLYVTTGVGTSIIPVRFRVPPEIVVLTLSSE